MSQIKGLMPLPEPSQEEDTELEQGQTAEPEPEAVEPEPQTSHYLSSIVASTTSGTLKYFRANNGVVRFAWDIREAIAANDQAWLDAQKQLILDMTAYYERLRLRLDEEDFSD